MSRPFVPEITLGGALLATAGLVLSISAAASRPVPAREAKFHDAERLVVYELAAGETTRVALARDERSIFLVTHAVTDAPLPPDATLRYPMRVRLVQPFGYVLFERTLWTESRHSRARLEGDVWLDENTFTTDDAAITDGRSSRLALPDGVQDGAVLEFSLPVQEQVRSVLLRAYRRVELSETLRPLRELALAPAERERFAGGHGVLRWEALPESERHRRVGTAWRRIPALGEDGHGYRLRTIFHTDFHAPRQAADEAEELGGARPRGLAWNVVGPTRVEVRALGAPVAIATTSEGGARRTVPEHAALRDGERRTPIEVGPGVHTVTVRLDTGTAEAQLVATTPDESVPFARSPRHPVEGGERWLEPDRRRIRTYHTDLAAGLGEVCWRTDGEGDDLSRTTRLDVRLLGDAATSAEAVEVRYRFLDAEGRAIAEGAARVASTWSDFEFVEVRPETSASTTEPVPLYLVAPPRAVSLCAATTTGAVLRALTPTPDEDALDPVYAEHVSEEVRWRYAPMRWRPWLPLRALAHAELESASRATLLIAQSRLELPARADGSSAAERHYTELQPFGRPPRERILEQVEDTARGPSELFVETPRAPIDVVGGGDASAARAVYWLEEGAEIGGELTIVSGAETLLRTVLRARSGALSFGPLGPAPQPLRALGPSSARVFVAASPVRAGLPRFALRTAFALLPAAPLRVSTPARSRSLWVVVYARGTAPLGDLVLRARVDGGSPERRVGVPLTSVGRAERAWTVPGSTEPPALFLDRRDLGGLRPRIVRIPLGADLAETRHLVDVWLEVGAAGSVFARLLVETAGVEAGEPAVPLFRRSVVPIEDGDE